MAFVKVSEKKGTGRTGGACSDDFRIAITTSGKKSRGVGGLSVTLSIPVRLMKELRWVIGDRVDLLRDEEAGLFLLSRSLKGYTLSPQSDEKGAAQKLAGTVARPTMVKFPHYEFFVDQKMPVSPCENVTVGESGLLFVVPPAFLKEKL